MGWVCWLRLAARVKGCPSIEQCLVDPLPEWDSSARSQCRAARLPVSSTGGSFQVPYARDSRENPVRNRISVYT